MKLLSRVQLFATPWTVAYHAPPSMGFSQAGLKNPPANAGDVGDAGLIPGSGRSPGGGNGNPLQYSCLVGGSQYSCLENPMDGGAWWAAVHEVAKSLTRLSDFILHPIPPSIRDFSNESTLRPIPSLWVVPVHQPQASF